MIAWIKKNYPYVGALVGLLMIPYVLITTPSLSDSHRKYSIMKNDLRVILHNGGTVISKEEVDKYGVADIAASFFAGSLTVDIRNKNLAAIISLGWIPIGRLGNEYCKDGILFSSYFSDEDHDGNKVVIMNFRYTSQTIRLCKVSEKQATFIGT